MYFGLDHRSPIVKANSGEDGGMPALARTSAKGARPAGRARAAVEMLSLLGEDTVRARALTVALAVRAVESRAYKESTRESHDPLPGAAKGTTHPDDEIDIARTGVRPSSFPWFLMRWERTRLNCVFWHLRLPAGHE